MAPKPKTPKTDQPAAAPGLKAYAVNTRFDEETGAWLKDLEIDSGVEPVMLIRALVGAAKRFHTTHGYLAFPLQVIDSSQTTQTKIQAASTLLAESSPSYGRATPARKSTASGTAA